MAEQIPYAVAATIIDRLTSAAFREFGRIYGVMNELETLKKTLESIRAVLLDAEDKQQQSHAVRNWIKRLKDDVLHPADDLLDEFLIENIRHKLDEAPKHKVTKVLHSLSPNKIVFRRKMAHEIETLQKNINDVVKDMSVLNLNQNVVVVEQSNNNNVKRETGSFVLESDIIGREDDKKEIINMLKQPNENHNVSLIAIVGIGGLGKTTLAQLVYKDKEVQNMFEITMWICVSDKFEIKTILKNMLESLTKNKIDNSLSLDNLQNMFHEKLSGKRYLLVLDDVWNVSYEKWAQLKTYLMCGAQNSKVVVTTRSKIVAQTMGVSVPYTLNGLTLEKSWNLLNNIITSGDEIKVVKHNLELIGKKIAHKCSGVPLAIRTLGGLLQGKHEENKWINVLEGEFWTLCKDEESIMPVLKLSYQNLSPQLRQCFAYCALYPKDWEIEKNKLIKLWMSQGYLECSDQNKNMEDIGNEFVDIFLMKSFIQDATLNVLGHIQTFKMHDLIHDLAMQVAGNDCCYLDSETKEHHVGSPIHVILDSEAIGLLESLDANRVRTLILLPNSNEDLLREKELSLISNFKKLRALELSNCSLNKFCDSIGKMKHLRYLSLLNCEALENIFRSISNGVCLQSLALTNCGQIELSRKYVSKLINLKKLLIFDDDLRVSKEKKTISRFGKLCIGGLYKGVIFSNWLSSLINIVEIYLIDCSSLRYLPPMERLPFLKKLAIHSQDELEYIYYEEPLLPETFFPSLEQFSLKNCDDLRGWRGTKNGVNEDNTTPSCNLSFPSCLSYLSIFGCPMLTHMPTFPNIGKRLGFLNSNIEALEATFNMSSSKCPIECPPLSLLEYFYIGGDDLDVKKLSKDWLKNMTALEHLTLWNFPSLALQEIEFWFMEDFNYLPSLQNIEVDDCSDLRALPDWFCNLSSLHHITIKNCKSLTSLPEEVSRLSKLHTLEIIGCPLLLEECKSKTSVTWSIIAHIPNIILKDI